MEANAWEFGWEALVALATLLLAGVTAWLALTTRRLARTTAEEVQGQIRPVVVPARRTVVSERSEHSDDYIVVRILLRNIGAGPAVNFNMTIGPMSSNDPLPALGAGSEREGIIRLPRRGENEGVMGWSTLRGRVVIEYFDLGGRRYTTDVGLNILSNEGETQISRYLNLTAGEVPRDVPSPSELPPMENPVLRVRDRTPGIRDLPNAWRYNVLQDADAAPQPLWPRLKRAWRRMYPRHRRTRYQRLVHARRAYKYTLDKPVRPWARGVLRRPYVIARGWKWGYLVYRNLR